MTLRSEYLTQDWAISSPWSQELDWVWAAPPSNCRKKGKEYRVRRKPLPVPISPFTLFLGEIMPWAREHGGWDVCSLRLGARSYSYEIFSPNPLTGTEHAGRTASCSCATGQPPCGMEWSLNRLDGRRSQIQYLDFFSLKTMFNRLEEKQKAKEPGWYLGHCFLFWKINEQKVIPRIWIKPHSLWNILRTLSTFSLKTTLLDRNNYYASHCGCKHWDMGELRTWFRIMQTARCKSDHQVGVSSAHRLASNQHVPLGLDWSPCLLFSVSSPHAHMP